MGVGLSIGVTGFICVVFWGGGFEWLEQHSYDLRMQWRGPEDMTSPIMLVLNDEATSEQLGVAPSRISRMVYAKAIHNLHRANAKFIAMDVLFADSQSELEDASLELAIKEAGNVILARYIGSDGHRVPLTRFARVALGQGLVNVRPDSDGVLRGVPLLGGQYDEGGFTPYLTLGAETARHVLDSGETTSLEFFSHEEAKIGSLSIPLVHNQVLVNYAGPSGTVASRSLWQVADGRFSQEIFAGKIVLVGSSVASLHDFYHIPLSNKDRQLVGDAQAGLHAAHMSGVEIHAHIIRTLLEGKGIQRTSAAMVFGLIGLLGTLCCVTVILLPRGEWGVVAATLFLLGVVACAVMFLFVYQCYWVDAVPLLAILNGHFAMATAYQRYLVVRQKDQLHAMFSHFLSPTIVENVWRQRASIIDGHRIVPRSLILTILLVRIRNMTAIIHGLDSEALLLWWSQYRNDLTRVLRPYGGLVSAWDDEGVRVYFGAPLPSSSREAIQQDVQQAVSCAFQVLRATCEHYGRWKEKGVPALEIVVILYTGSGIGGSIHDLDSPEYRVMGEVTQMTNRIDTWARESISLPKENAVLAGEPTVSYLDGSWQTQKVGDTNEWTGNGTVSIYHIQEPASPSLATNSLGEGL